MRLAAVDEASKGAACELFVEESGTDGDDVLSVDGSGFATADRSVVEGDFVVVAVVEIFVELDAEGSEPSSVGGESVGVVADNILEFCVWIGAVVSASA